MKLLIDDKEYEMKRKYKISEFKKLLAFDINVDINWRKLIGIAFDVPDKYLNYLSDDNIELAISFIMVYLNEIKSDYINENIINLDELKLSQYVDLDVYFSQGLHRSLEKVIEILYGVKEDDYINEYWGGVLYYLSWRQTIIKSYKNLFDSDGEEEAEPQNINVAKKWYNTVLYLADDDILKINNILELPLISVFNFLAYKKEKSINELRKLNNKH